MGKTSAGTVWLDPNRTSPYELYQFLRNVDDADVEQRLALLTLLPMDEVRRLGALEGSEINQAKEILPSRSPSLCMVRKRRKRLKKRPRQCLAVGNA